MIKMVLAAVCLLTAGGVAAAPKDWSKIVTATADGGYVMGNPKAKISLVEYGSYTCPHCKVFHDEGMATLKSKYIAPGRMRFEFRSFVRNGPDVAASLIVRCGGMAKYYPAIDRFYAQQESWVQPYVRMTDEQAKALEALEPAKQLLPLAKIGKLDSFLQPLGVTPAKAAVCLADPVALKALTDSAKTAVDIWHLEGTPTFVLDGKTLADTATWAALKPQLPAL